MTHWIFATGTAWCHQEATSWLEALPEALDQLELDRDTFDPVRCTVTADGVRRIADADGTVRLLASRFPTGRNVPEGAAERLMLRARAAHVGRASGAGAAEREQTGRLDEDEPEAHVTEAPPEGFAELLFDLTGAISDHDDPAGAAGRALDVVRYVFGDPEALVLFAGGEEPELEVLAERGGRYEGLVGASCPLGIGLAGEVHDHGIAVVIRNAARSVLVQDLVAALPLGEVDAVLAAPIRDDDGNDWGVVLVIDPVAKFPAWWAEALQQVTLALAERLTAINGA